MTDYIGIIAGHLSAGTPVILYTLGGDTFSVIRSLMHRYGLFPTAVCDRDGTKQGREYRGLAGVPVLSPDEAIRRYPNAQFFIASMYYRFEIMGELVDAGKVSSERIINWEPVEKRLSCKFWERDICVHSTRTLSFCWVEHSPRITFGGSINEAADRFSTMRSRLISGQEQKGVCSKCAYLGEGWWPTSRQAWQINYFGEGVCNFKCAYCTSPVHSAKLLNPSFPGLDDSIAVFRKSNMLSEFYSVVLSTSGEPALNPKRKQAYEAFQGYALLYNTNGSIFDEDLFQMMAQKMVRIIVSLDAGVRKTFAEVKGVDCFDKVKENLRRYSQSPVGIVVPKYIVVPGVNDDEANIEGFASLCVDLGVCYAIVAYDQNGVQPITEKTKRMIVRLKQDLENAHILCVPYAQYEAPGYTANLLSVLEG